MSDESSWKSARAVEGSGRLDRADNGMKTRPPQDGRTRTETNRHSLRQQNPPLFHQLLPLECNLLLKVNRGSFKIGNRVIGIKTARVEVVPSHGTPALPLKQSARFNHKVALMGRTLLRNE